MGGQSRGVGMTSRSRDVGPVVRPLVLVLLAGCVTQTIRVRPSTLAAHEAELVARPSARVETADGGHARVEAGHALTVWVPSTTTVSHARCLKLPKLPFRPCLGEDRVVANADTAREVTVRELVTGCAAGTCLARQLRDEPLAVGTRTRVSGEAIARTIGAAASAGLAGYCLAECEDAGKTFGVVGVVVAVGLLIQPLGLLAR